MKRLFQKNKTSSGSDASPAAPEIVPAQSPAPPRPAAGQRSERARPRVENVAAVIGYSCANAVLDYAYILALADFISTSSTASKDAARALRKELKYGAPETQERAVRLLGILMRNSDTRFKQEIASKRFLSELADLASNKKTQPAVLAMIQRVLSPLAYDYQRDSDLSSITQLYNKVKSIDGPMNGAPLDPEDSLFTPTAPARPSTRPEIPTDQAQIRSLRREAERARGNAGMLSEAVGFARSDELAGNELIQEFYAKCFNDQEIITQNLAWATAQAEQSRALVEANRVEVIPNPKAFGSNNPFASALDKENATPEIGTEPREPEQTEEEDALAQLLLANSEIIEALELHATRFRTANEQVELDQVQERSKQETKFDRKTAGTPDANAAYHDYESSGRDEVDEREQREAEENERAEEREREQQQSYQTQSTRTNQPMHSDTITPVQSAFPPSDPRRSMNPYAAYLTSTASPAVAPPSSPRSNNPYYVAPTPDERATTDSNYNFDFLDSYTNANDLQAPLQATSPFRSAPAKPATGRNGRDGLEIVIPAVSSLDLEDTDEESIKTPLEPSEKALGKMKSSSYTTRDP